MPYVSGVGLVKVAEHWDKPLRKLLAQAGLRAIDASGVMPDLVVVSSALSPMIQEQSHLAPLVLEEMGLEGTPSFSVEAGGASGGVAIHVAYTYVLSGLYRNVLVVGGDKLSDVLPMDLEYALMNFEDREYVSYYGVAEAALPALAYRVYLSRYGVGREAVASLSVHDHSMAVGVKHALYPFPVKIEKVVGATPIAEPLTMLERYGFGDGAAAVMITGDKTDVEVKAVEIATDRMSPQERVWGLSFGSTVKAAERAYKRAGVGPGDIDVAEICDPYTIVGVISLEDLGFAKRGEGAKMVSDGRFGLNGRPAINTFGGLKARGHPIGGTGIYQVAELALQLRGEAVHQADSPKYGLAHVMGGFGGTSVVTILGVA